MAVISTIAIILMAIHLIRADVVLPRNRNRDRDRDRDREKLVLHRLSVGASVLWPIPYVAGATTAVTGT